MLTMLMPTGSVIPLAETAWLEKRYAELRQQLFNQRVELAYLRAELTKQAQLVDLLRRGLAC